MYVLLLSYTCYLVCNPSVNDISYKSPSLCMFYTSSIYKAFLCIYICVSVIFIV
uniref:Uncharacterized protein n=1 Tax=Octopus bimaculoides TaxID=37653 RepID=A0A0L8GVF1_OCTBM